MVSQQLFEYTGSLLRGSGVNNETHHLSIAISRSKECTLDLLYLVLLLLTATSAQGRICGWLLCLPSVLIYWPPNLPCVKITSRWIWPFSAFCAQKREGSKVEEWCPQLHRRWLRSWPYSRYLMMFFAHPNRIGNPKSWSCASKMSPIRLRFWAR